jgi:dienelactone hydrolase
MHSLARAWGTVGALVLLLTCGAPADDPAASDAPPRDSRLDAPRTLRDAYHPWQPPETLAEWEAQRDRIRRQLLVATGLWPMPEKPPLEPVVHGKVDRDDYTVEKVFFASRPGLYVTGNLYRPKGREGKLTAVLSPHGHWANGRFYDAGEQAAQKQIEAGAETLMAAARHPLQARMVQLARMGCVVFHYDMIGYADQGPLDHRTGFSDAQAELWSQNIMGLQTWNSIRALDFLASLPDVDPERIAVTGASGGGTQTFALCAIDPRPAVAFPAVMVSTAMQGGCVCENASWLRNDLNNVAFAACFAPKPLGMSGANDWTIDIETKGLPELRQVYGLYDKPDLVTAKCFPQFGHNYNQVSRRLMYAWLNEHLRLGLDAPDLEERDFQPLTREEMSVFTAEHPRPDDALAAEELRKLLTEESREWFSELVKSGDSEKLREVIGGAADVMFGAVSDAKPQWHETSRTPIAAGELVRGWVGRKGTGIRIPTVLLVPAGRENPPLVVWMDGEGISGLIKSSGEPILPVRRLLEAGHAVASADVLYTGESVPMDKAEAPQVDETFAGYTFGYNRPLLSERVRDVAAVREAITDVLAPTQTHLVGTGEAGLWVLLARGLSGDKVERTLVDLQQFSFESIDSTSDPNMLPGALKFGGVAGFLSLQPAGAVHLYGVSNSLREDYARTSTRPLPQRQGTTQLLQPGEVDLLILK